VDQLVAPPVNVGEFDGKPVPRFAAIRADCGSNMG
jgi:hypothetical protein